MSEQKQYTLEELFDQNKALKDILYRLVEFKDYKDKNGKDELYTQEQPILWEKARNILSNCENSKCNHPDWAVSFNGSENKRHCSICGKYFN